MLHSGKRPKNFKKKFIKIEEQIINKLAIDSKKGIDPLAVKGQASKKILMTKRMLGFSVFRKI